MVQAPLLQTAVALAGAQAALQAPQWSTLLWVLVSQPSTNAPLQSARPCWQETMPQWPALQARVEAKGAAHLALQAPQWLTSVEVLKPSSICPSQSLSIPSQASTPLLVRTQAYSQPLASLL